MPPPTTSNRFSGDDLGHSWDGPFAEASTTPWFSNVTERLYSIHVLTPSSLVTWNLNDSHWLALAINAGGGHRCYGLLTLFRKKLSSGRGMNRFTRSF